MFVRRDTAADRIVISHRTPTGAIVHIASHTAVGRGEIAIIDVHFPTDHPTGPTSRYPQATNSIERQFLAIGTGAYAYIQTAAAAGIPKLMSTHRNHHDHVTRTMDKR